MERPDRREAERKQIAAIMTSLRRSMKARLDSGLFPYYGRWLTLAEVQKAILAERTRARVHAFELILLYCLNLTASFLIIGLVWLLCY